MEFCCCLDCVLFVLSKVLVLMLPTIDSWPSKDGLRIGHLNINHAKNKLSDVASVLLNSGKQFHLFGFSESHLTEDDEKDMDGYETISRLPSAPLETGILVYVNKSVKYRRITQFESYSVESVWLEIFLKGTKSFFVGFIYQNPAEHVDWRDRFSTLMKDVLPFSEDVILLGDFNIDLLDPQDYGLNYINLLI